MHDNDNDNKQKNYTESRLWWPTWPSPNLKVAITRACPRYTCTYYYVM